MRNSRSSWKFSCLVTLGFASAWFTVSVFTGVAADPPQKSDSQKPESTEIQVVTEQSLREALEQSNQTQPNMDPGLINDEEMGQYELRKLKSEARIDQQTGPDPQIYPDDGCEPNTDPDQYPGADPGSYPDDPEQPCPPQHPSEDGEIDQQ